MLFYYLSPNNHTGIVAGTICRAQANKMKNEKIHIPRIPPQRIERRIAMYCSSMVRDVTLWVWLKPAPPRPPRIHELRSKRRVMGDVISRIANFLGFYQVSVYTIYIYQPLRIVFTYFAA